MTKAFGYAARDKASALVPSIAGGVEHRRDPRDAGDARLLRRTRDRVDIELTPIQRINQAYEQMIRNDVKYRFVIDMASLKPER
jgi:hypothetical protein